MIRDKHIPTLKSSPQYEFLLECLGYSFFSRKTLREFDKWEMFAMGFRKMEAIVEDGRFIIKHRP